MVCGEEGKGGIYLEKENIYLCQVEENMRKKMRKTFGEGIFFSSEEKKMETEKRKFLGEGKCHDDRHTHSNFEEGTRIVDSELAIIIIFPKTMKS